MIEMTGTFTRNAIAGVEGVWMRPSTQVFTLRFRRSAGANPSSFCSSSVPAVAAPRAEDALTAGTVVEGSIDWPEEQASAEFKGRIVIETPPSSSSPAPSAVAANAVLTLEGEVGEVFQGPPERVGWVAGSRIKGTFCRDGTDGTVKGSWSAKAPAVALEPLAPGGMRINVGLLPDRLLAVEGSGPEDSRCDESRPGSRQRGSSSALAGDPIMGSSCR